MITEYLFPNASNRYHLQALRQEVERVERKAGGLRALLHENEYYLNRLKEELDALESLTSGGE